MNDIIVNEVTSIKLGTQIRKMRIMLELTLTELAKRAGISKSYLSSIEANDKMPDIKILFKICQGIDIEPHELMLKAYFENKNGVTESCWDNNYSKIKKSLEIVESKLYPKETEVQFSNNLKEALMTAM